MPTGNRTRWQEKVKDYDRNGPGVLGYYLDTVSLMASLCPLYPEERNAAGDWERSEDPVLIAAVAGFRGKLQSQIDLVTSAVRSRESLGCVWIIHDRQTGWNVTNSVAGGGGTPHISWIDLYGDARETPTKDVFRSWVPDPYEPHLPTSPIRRAIPDLRRLRSVVRNQTRAADSRAIVNGILAFPPEPGENNRPFATGQAGQDLSGVDQQIEDFLELSTMAFGDDDLTAAYAPFPYKGTPPQWVAIGREIDQTALEAETVATSSFARAVNFPEQLLTQGPGQSTHWNEYLTQESAVKMGLSPKMQPLCDDVTTFYLRSYMIPVLRQKLVGWGPNPQRVRINYDLSFLLGRPPRSAELMQAYLAGVATRDEVASDLGIEVMELPEGMSEYEHWEIASGRAGAPYADVDANNNLVSDTPPGPPGGAGGFPALPSGVSQPALPMLAGGGPNAQGYEVQEPPNGPPVVAALPAPAPPQAPLAPALHRQPGTVLDGANPTKVSADAATRDQRLQASLMSIAAAAQIAVAADVVKKLIVAHPAQSDLRQKLRTLTPDKVWATADPAVLHKFDLEGIIANDMDAYRDRIAKEINQTADGFRKKWGDKIAPRSLNGRADVAAAAMTAGLTAWLVNRTTAGAIATAAVPAAVVRAAMMTASGASNDSAGGIVMGAGNTPIPASGGEWKGNYGFLTGDAVVRLLPQTYGLKWVHGFYGEPDKPFEPHVNLDGVTRPSLSSYAPYFPFDHQGCTCALLPDYETHPGT